MLNAAFRSAWLMGAWVAAMGIVVATSMTMGANVSTTAALLSLGVAPAVLVAILAQGRPSPTVAQILHSVETTAHRW